MSEVAHLASLEVNGALFTDIRITARTEEAVTSWQLLLEKDSIVMSRTRALEDMVLYALETWSNEGEGKYEDKNTL